MKAIILSAGKGSRLLPLTQDKPKCLLPLNEDHTILSWQLAQLDAAGVSEAVVVSGFKTELVEQEVAAFQGSMRVRTLYNPFYHVADNLGTVWMAREEMDADGFMIINGDTIFTADVMQTLLNNSQSSITLTTSVKSSYDDDDMKVQRDGAKLLRVSKKLDLSIVNAESIGVMAFKGEGVAAFKAKVEAIIRDPDVGTKVFYLSVIDALAQVIEISIADVPSDSWQEVDFPEDYEAAKIALKRWLNSGSKQSAAA